MEKVCGRCQHKLPESEFSISKQTNDGLNTYCRRCNTAYQRERALLETQERMTDKICWRLETLNRLLAIGINGTYPLVKKGERNCAYTTCEEQGQFLKRIIDGGKL